MQFTNDIKHKIASLIAAQNYSALDFLLSELSEKLNGDNKKFTDQFREFLTTGAPLFSVFGVDGNGKLPFVTFSSLAGAAFCDGAGDCLNWCYSFKAWRYPAAFYRQCQNAVLLQSESGRQIIAEKLAALVSANKTGKPLDLRLYVDGDFSSDSDFIFWADTLAAHVDDLRAYGYSKSFEIILRCYAAGYSMPDNYLLNLSGGHKYGADIVEKMESLPFVRGHFKAVSIGRKIKSSEHGTKAVNSALRAAYGKKAFTCAGKCGDCTPKGHACGLPTFNDIDIIIAVH